MSLDEVATHRRTRAKLQGFVEPEIGAAGGRIVKRTGDGALAEFPDARAAIHCAARIQRHNEAEEAGQPADRRIRFRIGITLGRLRPRGRALARTLDLPVRAPHCDGVRIPARARVRSATGEQPC